MTATARIQQRKCEPMRPLIASRTPGDSMEKMSVDGFLQEVSDYVSPCYRNKMPTLQTARNVLL